MQDLKQRKGILVLAGACLLAAVLIALLFVGRQRLIRVMEFAGEVIMHRSAAAEALPVFAGMRMEKKDRIETGNAAEVALSIDQDKLVWLSENTTATFEELAGGKRRQDTIVYLERGVLVNDIKERLQGDSSYVVRTPNATVSVRGTFFTVRVGENEPGYEGLVTVVNVYHGSVLVESPDKSAIIITADGKSESQLVVPQDNHAIVGERTMELREGVDYIGLNETNLRRVAELSEEKPSAQPAQSAHEADNTQQGDPDASKLPETKNLSSRPAGTQATTPSSKSPTVPVKGASSPNDQDTPSGNNSGNSGGETSRPGNSESSGEETPRPPASEADKTSYPPVSLSVSNRDAINEQISDLQTKIDALNALGSALTIAQKEELNRSVQNLNTASARLSDVDTANKALSRINELPYPSQILSGDKTKIEQARAVFNELTTGQKGIVPLSAQEKLAACEKKLK